MRIRLNKVVSSVVLGLSVSLVSGAVFAQLGESDLKRIGIEGTELTPMGAVRAGNAEGTIPEWSSVPIKGVEGGNAESLADPFADEKPLFTITAANYTEHQEKLTPGQIAMFKQYPESYKMHVYPTHRTGSYDKWVYDATLEQAKHAKVCPEYATENKICLSDHVEGGGIPFPIPKTGEEAIWNHLLAFREVSMDAMMNGALIDSNGRRTDVITRIRQVWPWWAAASSKLKEEEYLNLHGGAIFCGSQLIETPPRSAGLVFGACLYAADISTHAYLYIPGQRRVRKAPEIGFHDSSAFGADGQVTSADRWMMWFGGLNPRHTFSKPVKKEIYVPYNNYKLTNAETSFDEIFGEEHLNQDLVRYELHRVWVIEKVVKEGFRDLYAKQVAYFDEDTWLGLANEAYDTKGRLWRVAEQHNVFFYGPNVSRAIGDVHIDLLNGRYATYPYWQHQSGKEMGFGEPKITASGDEELGFNMDIFTPQGLRKFGRR